MRGSSQAKNAFGHVSGALQASLQGSCSSTASSSSYLATGVGIASSSIATGVGIASSSIAPCSRAMQKESLPDLRHFFSSQSCSRHGQKVMQSFSKRLNGGRCQSTSTSTSTGSKVNIEQIQKGLARSAVKPKESIASARAAVYNRMPNQMKQLIHSAQQPGNLQRVMKLHLEAFWQRHSRSILIVGAVLLVYSLWRTLFYFAGVFFKFSESMADLGFLALAAAMASFGYLYLRRLYTINPDSIYRNAMYQLNTNPGILEVMGAPVTGSSVRATVTRGGGLTLKGLIPRFRSRKVQMIFPLTGADRRGLVSVEAKKQGGRYLFKLLAVDAPTLHGQDQRIFLEGDQKVYDKGGVMNELRDPFLRALSLKDSDEVDDDLDDAAQEAHEAQKKREKEVAKLKSSPKPLDAGGGMYFYERVYWFFKNAFKGTGQEVTPKGSQDRKDAIAKAGEVLNTASNPTPPITTETDRVHQYKKEASVQQAP